MNSYMEKGINKNMRGGKMEKWILTTQTSQGDQKNAHIDGKKPGVYGHL